MTTTFFRSTLLDHATRTSRVAGNYRAWHLAEGKLKFGPVFFGLPEIRPIPDAERFIDFGYGRGLPAYGMLEACGLHESGNWPAHWSVAPKNNVMPAARAV